MLNELRELVRLNCPMGQVLSVFVVFCMHLEEAMQYMLTSDQQNHLLHKLHVLIVSILVDVLINHYK